MDRGYSAKSRSIDQSHARTCRVDAVRLYIALPHLSRKLLQIQPGRSRLTTQDRLSLAVDDLVFRALAVDLVVDLLVVVRRQRDADLHLVANDDRLRPHGIAQLQN